jgi:undecaprenyl-diphosphatase
MITAVMKFFTHLGDAPVVISFCLLLFAVPRAVKTISVPVSVAVITAAFLNLILKNAFARERPDILRLINETSYSFPSGHAMNNAALYVMLTLLTIKYVKNKPKKIVLTVFYIFLPVVIGFSRLYLGVHYAGDILGGWLLGFLVALIVFYWWASKGINEMKETAK